MASVTPLIEERVRFGSDIPAETNQCLQSAAASPQSDRAEAVLARAAALGPEVLAVDVARYKFYFYRGQLAEAETVVRGTLSKASAQGGFAEDWTRHHDALTGREYAEGPQRYYLYALKALAFISLRQERREQAAGILQALRTLDPGDLIGASVIEDLMDGSEDDA